MRCETDPFVSHAARIKLATGPREFLRDTARYKSGADVKQSVDRVKINILLSNFPCMRIFYCLNLRPKIDMVNVHSLLFLFID